MSYSTRISNTSRQPDESSVVDVDFTISCQRCLAEGQVNVQAEKIKYNTKTALLFWQCPNGHDGYIEDFDYFG